ncbi:MAG: SDR family oxidoreductase [Bacteroidota bacterium]
MEFKKILILDATGMAGHVISQYLNSLHKYQITNLNLDNPSPNDILIDIYNTKQLKETILREKPAIIINCLRLLIEESEANPDKAIYFNSYIPHYLSKVASEINAKVIQLSTDCVFSGKKGAYNEDDFKDGENYYARTKALGELVNERDLTLRTSFIGPNINNKNEELFHWFLMQKGEINGYSNAYWTGVTTLELAKSIEKAIELNLTGLHHVVPSEKISKFDLLNLIKEIWQKDDVSIKECNTVSIDKSLINNKKAIAVANYTTMFSELNQWMLNNKELYGSYI